MAAGKTGDRGRGVPMGRCALGPQEYDDPPHLGWGRDLEVRGGGGVVVVRGPRERGHGIPVVLGRRFSCVCVLKMLPKNLFEVIFSLRKFFFLFLEVPPRIPLGTKLLYIFFRFGELFSVIVTGKFTA